ncbi:hypothetical protein Cgig2_017124 [Carnegiea gigantea]|uniref:Uncharacterized protein n=1 Tax=Carnegiea gigantea TaxID=171969 RepID=A0A9Q1GJ15_9CARY|nr:hypothetical protein Cgig2_017124 [Carnegiea gigantea]
MIGFRRTKHGTYELFKFHEGHTRVALQGSIICSIQIARSEKTHSCWKKDSKCCEELKELDRGTSKSKMSELESFIGSSAPERIDILPPKHCHAKRSGKRLKGGKEKAMKQQEPPPHQKKKTLGHGECTVRRAMATGEQVFDVKAVDTSISR